MGDSNIGWTQKVWNPVVGCQRVSPGCENCYAEAFTGRLEAMGQTRYKGLTVLGKQGRRWTGEIRLVPDVLATPMHWRKPARVFVNSMSDLFHKDVPFEYIAAVFLIMAMSPHHVFQVLTKRPERALAFFRWFRELRGYGSQQESWRTTLMTLGMPYVQKGNWHAFGIVDQQAWPLPNVHLGVSVEDQQRAEERIPVLFDCDAAVRWISYEPALGPLNLREEWLHGRFIECPDETQDEETDPCRGCDGIPNDGMKSGDYCGAKRGPKLDWVVSGGESGPGRREIDVSCIENVARACKAAGVPNFTKQDGGPRPGSQGRISDEVWAMKEYPR